MPENPPQDKSPGMLPETGTFSPSDAEVPSGAPATATKPIKTDDDESEATESNAAAVSVESEEDAEQEADMAEDVRRNRVTYLRQSIINSQSLLAFSAESSVSIPPQVVAGITSAQRTFGTTNWTPEIENAFWQAFRELSLRLKPVTSNSLQWVATQSRRVTITFISLGILSLLLLIFGQIFWVYINNTSTQIRESIKALNEKEALVTELDGTIRLLDGQIFSPQFNDLTDADRQKIQQNRNKSTAKSNTYYTEIDQIKRLLTAQYVILADWVPKFAGDPKPAEPGWFDSSEQAKAKQTALAKWYDEQNTERDFEKEYLLAQAGSILALMSTYVLPVLYGVLGTFAYILRSISRGVEERVLNESTILNFWVRIPLGMLSGVAVGWFLTSETLPTGWESVQPLAFAFVAGYSVELIFTGMDRLVGAFTGKNQAGTP